MIEGAGLDFDEDFVGADGGRGDVAIVEDVGRAVLIEDDGSHGGLMAAIHCGSTLVPSPLWRKARTICLWR
jgi:hypothetical protein